MPDGSGFVKNVKIFGTDMTSCVHIGNKKKDTLIFDRGPTQGLNATKLTTEN